MIMTAEQLSRAHEAFREIDESAGFPEIMPGEYDAPPRWVRVMRVCIISGAIVLGCAFAAGLAALVWRAM